MEQENYKGEIYCNQLFLDKAEHLPASLDWFLFPHWGNSEQLDRKELEGMQWTELILKNEENFMEVIIYRKAEELTGVVNRGKLLT